MFRVHGDEMHIDPVIGRGHLRLGALGAGSGVVPVGFPRSRLVLAGVRRALVVHEAVGVILAQTRGVLLIRLGVGDLDSIATATITSRLDLGQAPAVLGPHPSFVVARVVSAFAPLRHAAERTPVVGGQRDFVAVQPESGALDHDSGDERQFVFLFEAHVSSLAQGQNHLEILPPGEIFPNDR